MTSVEFSADLDAWVVSSDAAVRAALRMDGVELSNRAALGPRFGGSMRTAMRQVLDDPDSPPDAVAAARNASWSLLNTADPPDHDRHRRAVNAVFSARRVADLAPDIERVADGLLDRILDGTEHDVIPTYAEPLTAAVIASLIGVPDADRVQFGAWVGAITALFNGAPIAPETFVANLTAQGELFAYFLDKIAAAHHTEAPGLLGALTRGAKDGNPLTDTEIAGLLTIIIVAGTETSTNLLSSTLLRIATDPALEARLRADASLVGGVVEEALRLDAPSQGIFRRARTDLVLDGVAVAKGDHLFLHYAAANRDTAVHPDPLVLDAERPRAHLAFGHGLHFCLGAPLARREAAITVEHVLARADGVALPEGFVAQWRPGYLLRGLQTLPLTLTARQTTHQPGPDNDLLNIASSNASSTEE